MKILCAVALLFICLAGIAVAMPEQGQLPATLLDVAFASLPLSVQGAVLTALGIGGMLSHYLKKWTTKEITGSLLDYLVRDDPRRTVAAVMGVIAGMSTAYFAGQFGDAVTIKQIFIPAFLIGYTGDSALNKGTAPDTAA